MLRAISLWTLMLASSTEAENAAMSPEDALALWATVKWAHFNCPNVAIHPIAYMMTAEVEKKAPAETLARAEEYAGPRIVERFGSVELACDDIEKGLGTSRSE